MSVTETAEADAPPELAVVMPMGPNEVLVRLDAREVEVRRHGSRLITVHDPARRRPGRVDLIGAWHTTRFRGRLVPFGDGSCSPEWTRPFVEAALGEGGL